MVPHNNGNSARNNINFVGDEYLRSIWQGYNHLYSNYHWYLYPFIWLFWLCMITAEKITNAFSKVYHEKFIPSIQQQAINEYKEENPLVINTMPEEKTEAIETRSQHISSVYLNSWRSVRRNAKHLLPRKIRLIQRSWRRFFLHQEYSSTF